MILYSFRRCPYAIRARLVLTYAQAEWEHREVVLRDKPASMLKFSPKGTVPVLVLEDRVIDESLEIILWALKTLPNCRTLQLSSEKHKAALALIEENDSSFKTHLTAYKYAKSPEESALEWKACLVFIIKLDTLLQAHSGLFGEVLSFADYALFPFLRQCRKVNEMQFDTLPTPHIQTWMRGIEQSELFQNVMRKHSIYQDSSV